MEIPHQKLSSQLLRALIEEFVTRDDNAVGEEHSLEAKIAQVHKALEKGKARIMYDETSESCNIVSIDSLRRPR